MPDLRLAAYSFVWVVCLGAAAGRLYDARHEYDDRPAATDPDGIWQRPGGNSGHTHIDFGGQWVIGRTAARGHFTQLYDRNRLRQTARGGYPVDREPPAARDQSFPRSSAPRNADDEPAQHDADALLDWFMGHDSPRWGEVGAAVALPFAAADPFAASALPLASAERVTPDLVEAVSAKAVGGPLYPPLHAFFYAPLCYDDDPAAAYRRFQCLCVGLTFAAGLAVSVISRGKVWWPAATLFLLLYPGYRSGLVLGQNPAVTLTIVLTGWALAVRGRDTAGGLVWGLLAFKPVWGLAFVIVPLLLGRWRFVLAMGVSGCGLAAATLPFTGVDVWLDWLSVGRAAAAKYLVNKNWVELSRDLHGIPRRVLLDFDQPEDQRSHPWAGPIGWGLWGTVMTVTVAVALWRGRRREPTGLLAGFVFLGAFLTCYRFMYYDVLLSAAGVAVLWADPGRLFRFATWQYQWLPLGPRWVGYLTAGPVFFVAFLLAGELVLHPWQPRATVELAAWERPAPADPAADPDGTAPAKPTVPKLVLAVGYYVPWETVLVLGLWGWCGWRLAWAGHRSDDV